MGLLKGHVTLADACRQGDIRKVQKRLGENPSAINIAIDANGTTPLMLAAANGHSTVVDLLLKTSPPADPNMTNKAGKTAAQLAKDSRQEKCAQMVTALARSSSSKEIGLSKEPVRARPQSIGAPSGQPARLPDKFPGTQTKTAQMTASSSSQAAQMTASSSPKPSDSKPAATPSEGAKPAEAQPKALEPSSQPQPKPAAQEIPPPPPKPTSQPASPTSAEPRPLPRTTPTASATPQTEKAPTSPKVTSPNTSVAAEAVSPKTQARASEQPSVPQRAASKSVIAPVAPVQNQLPPDVTPDARQATSDEVNPTTFPQQKSAGAVKPPSQKPASNAKVVLASVNGTKVAKTFNAGPNDSMLVQHQVPSTSQFVIDIDVGGTVLSVVLNTTSPVSGGGGTGDELKTKITGAGLKSGSAGHPGTYSLQFVDGNDNPTKDPADDVVATVVAPSGKEFAGTVSKQGNGVFDVSYTSTESGSHAVRTRLVRQFERFVVIDPDTTDAASSVAAGEGLHLCSSLKTAEFTIQARDRHGNNRNEGGDKFVVDITSPSGKRTSGDVRDLNDGTYVVKYQGPLEGGDCTLAVNLAGKHIQGSPFVLTTQGPPDATKSTAHGDGILRGVAGVESKFTIVTKDATGRPVLLGGYDIRCTWAAAGAKEQACTIIDNNNGTYDVLHTPTVAGNNKVSPFILDHHLAGSPYKVLVSEGPVDAASCVASGAGVSTANALLETKCVIQAMDRFGNKCKSGGASFAIDIPGKRISPEIIDNKNGTYGGVYTAPDGGDYKLNITLGKKHIKSSPYSLHVIGEPDASKCELSGDGLRGGVAGVPCVFSLKSFDSASNPISVGGYDVKLSAVGPNGATVGGEVKDNQDGTYGLRFVPTCSGPNSVIIQIQDTQRAPVDVPVVPGPTDAATSTCEGSGLTDANAGDKLELKVVGKDTFGNMSLGGDKFTASLVLLDPKDASIPISLSGDNGVYVAQYQAPASHGKHELAVTLDGRHVSGSPFAVFITAGPDPSKTKVSGIDTTTPGVPKPFVVELVNQAGVALPMGGHSVKCSLKMPGGKEVAVPMEDKNNGSYTGSLVPTEVGDCLVHVFVEGEPTSGSPFLLKVLEGPAAAATSTASGPGLTFANALKPATFYIQAADGVGNFKRKGGDIFTVTLSGGTVNTTIPVKDNGTGTYDVTYSAPKEGGQYTFDVRLGQQPIKNNPFALTVQPPPSEKSHLEIETSTPTAGKPVTAILRGIDKDSKPVNVGGYIVTGMVTSSSGAKTDVTVEDLCDGSYRLSFSLTEAGAATLDAYILDQKLATCPLTFDVAPGPAVSGRPFGSGLVGGFCTKTLSFTVQAIDVYGNSVRVGGEKFQAVLSPILPRSVKELNEARVPNGPDPQPFVADCLDHGDGTYTLSYVPTEVCRVVLRLTLNDRLIETDNTACIIPATEENIIQKLFRKYDANNSGMIDEIEYALLLDALGAACSFRQKIDMYNDVDPNHDTIDIHEFEVFYYKYWQNLPTRVDPTGPDYEAVEWTMEDEEMTKRAFAKYDTSGDGFIGQEEFDQLLEDLGLILRAVDRIDLFNSINVDNNPDGVNYQTFEDWWFSFAGRKSAQPPSDGEAAPEWNNELEKALKASFDKYDESGDALISFLEFGLLLEDMGCEDYSTSKIMGLYEKIDQDGSGAISYDEFRGWWIVFSAKHRKK